MTSLAESDRPAFRGLWVLTAAVVAICVMPALLNLLGADFASQGSMLTPEQAGGMTPGELKESVIHSLAGSFVHTILEWSAFCTAIFTAVLATIVFWIKRDVTVPIIAMALVCAGAMDAFHTLAADHLIGATAPNENLIPFTWAVCRAFNALILMAGMSVILIRRKVRTGTPEIILVFATSLTFGAVAYGVIYFCAVNANLPQTMFPESVVTRPWDAIALVFFLLIATVFCPMLYRQQKNWFVLTLWIGMVPAIATQLHMVFGSTTLFDNHFNIAHFIKIVSYAAPLLGLLADYVTTYRVQETTAARLEAEVEERQRVNVILAQAKDDVENAYAELESQKMAMDRHALLAVTDPAGRIIYVNDRLCEVSGYAREDLMGQTHRIFNSGHHPRSFWVEVWKTITRGHIWQGEVCNRTKNGGIYWVDTTIVPFKDSAGLITQYVAIRTDITANKEAEAAILEANEDLTRVNSELSQFVYIASHDLKSPLLTMIGFTTHLKRQMEAGEIEGAKDSADRVEGAARRMKICVDDLLSLGRIGREAEDVECVDVEAVIEDVLLDLQGRLAEKPAVINVKGPLPTVTADAARIKQVFLNLIGNALFHGIDVENLIVEIGAAEKNGQIVFYVRDNGPGIAPEFHQKIFGIFQRLSTSAESTGVGLAIVGQIAENYGGRAWVESALGEGATFWISFAKGEPDRSQTSDEDVKSVI